METSQSRPERTSIETLYANFWGRNQTQQGAIALSMEELAQGLDKTLTKGIVLHYAACLAELTSEQAILAFSRASMECRFFPSPSILREFSGRAATGDPIASEAKEELLKLIAGMRGPHGPMLKPIPGRILYGTDDDPKDADGNRVSAPIRGESTPFSIARRTQAALVRIGWGDGAAGLALIADHPAVRRSSTVGYADPQADTQFKQNQLRASDEILKRFVDAYREV